MINVGGEILTFRERLTETSLITLTKRVNSAAHRGQYAVVLPRSQQLRNTNKHRRTPNFQVWTRHAHKYKFQCHRTWPRKCPLIHTSVRLHFPFHAFSLFPDALVTTQGVSLDGVST